jgi:hypothetical protein
LGIRERELLGYLINENLPPEKTHLSSFLLDGEEVKVNEEKKRELQISQKRLYEIKEKISNLQNDEYTKKTNIEGKLKQTENSSYVSGNERSLFEEIEIKIQRAEIEYSVFLI